MIPKYKRIQELSEMGFNTPRMIYVPAYILNTPSTYITHKRVHAFLKSVRHQDFVNIRTYKAVFEKNGEKETWNSEHLIYTPLTYAFDNVERMSKDGFHCMIDAENPANGLYSGNVQMHNNDNEDFVLEYCYKEQGGAMVRDANLHVSGSFPELVTGRMKMDEWLFKIVRESFNKFTHVYKSVILEWTVGLGKCGVKGERMIFWEWRDGVK